MKRLTVPVVFMMIIVGAFAAGLVIASVSYVSRGQDQSPDTMRDYLINIRDNRLSAYIGLIAPIDVNPGWSVPENFTNDAGEIITRRIIGEIGEDFVCIDSLGQGLIVTSCIPFTNIAYVLRPAP